MGNLMTLVKNPLNNKLNCSARHIQGETVAQSVIEARGLKERDESPVPSMVSSLMFSFLVSALVSINVETKVNCIIRQ